MNDRRREKLMLQRARHQTLWRPGDDEFDMKMKTWHVLPGFYMFWMVLVRGWQAIARRRSPAQVGPPPALQWMATKSRRRRQRPWTIGPKPLDREG